MEWNAVLGIKMNLEIESISLTLGGWRDHLGWILGSIWKLGAVHKFCNAEEKGGQDYVKLVSILQSKGSFY